MSEDRPYYGELTCERCGRPVELSQAEVDAIRELERLFPDLKDQRSTVLCKVCQAEPVQ
jgi:hypothetical protein